jgi:hypothetical protein
MPRSRSFSTCSFRFRKSSELQTEILALHRQLDVTGVFVPAGVRENPLWREAGMPMKKYKPEQIERQQELGKEVVFRADAAFAKPENLGPREEGRSSV